VHSGKGKSGRRRAQTALRADAERSPALRGS
jgi:hypothetical protein